MILSSFSEILVVPKSAQAPPDIFGFMREGSRVAKGGRL